MQKGYSGREARQSRARLCTSPPLAVHLLGRVSSSLDSSWLACFFEGLLPSACSGSPSGGPLSRQHGSRGLQLGPRLPPPLTARVGRRDSQPRRFSAGVFFSRGLPSACLVTSWRPLSCLVGFFGLIPPGWLLCALPRSAACVFRPTFPPPVPPGWLLARLRRAVPAVPRASGLLRLDFLSRACLRAFQRCCFAPGHPRLPRLVVFNVPPLPSPSLLRRGIPFAG